jgi:hypothetical protein
MSHLRKVLDSDAATKVLPKSKFGQALAYMRHHGSSLPVYLGEGRLPIDNNDTERDLRRVAIGRKNWLFLGSEESGERTAVILTVLSSAHRHDLDEWSYRRDVLEQLARGSLDPTQPVDLESLLPEVWKLSHPQHVRTFRVDEKAAGPSVNGSRASSAAAKPRPQPEPRVWRLAPLRTRHRNPRRRRKGIAIRIWGSVAESYRLGRGHPPSRAKTLRASRRTYPPRVESSETSNGSIRRLPQGSFKASSGPRRLVVNQCPIVYKLVVMISETNRRNAVSNTRY